MFLVAIVQLTPSSLFEAVAQLRGEQKILQEAGLAVEFGSEDGPCNKGPSMSISDVLWVSK